MVYQSFCNVCFHKKKPQISSGNLRNDDGTNETGAVFRLETGEPLPIRDQDIADTHRIEIGELNRLKRGFDHHVMESESGYSPTSTRLRLLRLGLETSSP
ncbi:unnamed protein product [Microthlaspi erraticum]|uniref:Uncharacterized protein n=1 Tax=Microthlaspi erraticum TaxID=1685480 RepID=A0A6D2K8W9_9BRAS|nr:unnamed protein product [Microthlaspi erraticum]CAA7045953.1 unnamed protein product [Microthlaspi erraticum]